MKNWLLVIMAVVFFGALSGTGWSVEDYGIRNPIGPGTVPPSSYSSGLSQTPTPMDTSGNLMVTGNVGGGKHFRGSVPYGATTDFREPLESSSLDPFLRYSTAPRGVDRYAGGYTPFYSPTGTVTVTQVGYPGVIMPTSTKISGRVPLQEVGLPTGGLALGAVPGQQGFPSWDVSAAEMRLLSSYEVGARPMSRTPQELKKMISNELADVLPESVTTVQPRSTKLRAGQYRDMLLERTESQSSEKGQWDLSANALKEVDELKQSVPMQETIAEDESLHRAFPSLREDKSEAVKAEVGLQPLTGIESSVPTEQGSSVAVEQFETQRSQEPTSKGFATRSLLPNLSTKTDSSLPSQNWERIYRSRTGSGDGLAKEQLDAYERVKQQLNAAGMPKTGFGTQNADWQDKQGQQDYQAESSQKKSQFSMGGLSSLSEGLSRLPGTREGVLNSSALEIAAEAKTIRGEHETLESFFEGKFNWCIKAAELYLKQGKYYRAADAYSLAAIYKPTESLAYAGKSVALFAAGEYISSALFLSRALEISPEYAKLKIDLVSMLGSKDKLESRIADIKECLKIVHEAGNQVSNTADLQFLLAYVYYQTDRHEEAKAVIKAAFEKMPDSSAVKTVKRAIEEAR